MKKVKVKSFLALIVLMCLVMGILSLKVESASTTDLLTHFDLEGGNSWINTGNVGIGTTAPQARLDIKSEGATTSPFTITDNDTLNKLLEIYVGDEAHPNLYMSRDDGTRVIQLATNSYTYFNAGNVGVGTYNPTASLHVEGDTGVLFAGTYGIGSIPSEGSGTRMLWYPAKASLRAGYVSSTQWDDSNLGDYSVAFGTNTVASGISSMAAGSSAVALGNYSLAVGESTLASNESSFAVGKQSIASGAYSFAMGDNVISRGDASIALGNNTTGEAYSSLTIGRYNVTSDSYLGSEWIPSDPAFVIGNGTDDLNRSNALTVLKDGRVGIGMANPSYALDINGTINATGAIKVNGEDVLTSYTETDPVFMASDSSGITTVDISEWNTAYSWGNHSIQGYLTSETDPVFMASDSSGITSADISEWDTAYSWGDHSTQGYLTDETDPVFTTSDASGITSTDIDNWNTAFSWGDHPPSSGGIPQGAIIMWSGSIVSIPEGWALCDGTNGTPDLTDKFVLGAGFTYSVGDSGGSNSHSHTVNSHSHSIATHTHTINHGHSASTSSSGSYVTIAYTGGGTRASWYGHTHGVNVSTYSGTSGISSEATTGITGTNTDSIDHMPPYYSLAFIMKL